MTAEEYEVLSLFNELLTQVTLDGGRKRRAGLKPSWKVDTGHVDAFYRHLAAWQRDEKIDKDSGAHPLVHLAWRALALAYQESHAR